VGNISIECPKKTKDCGLRQALRRVFLLELRCSRFCAGGPEKDRKKGKKNLKALHCGQKSRPPKFKGPDKKRQAGASTSFLKFPVRIEKGGEKKIMEDGNIAQGHKKVVRFGKLSARGHRGRATTNLLCPGELFGLGAGSPIKSSEPTAFRATKNFSGANTFQGLPPSPVRRGGQNL